MLEHMKHVIFAAALLGLGTTQAWASFPAGVWGLPDSVEVLEGESATPKVKISGLFMVYTGTGPLGGQWAMDGYEAPLAGYLYYVCPSADKKPVCLQEWQDIKTSAEQDSCVGWGESQSKNNGK